MLLRSTLAALVILSFSVARAGDTKEKSNTLDQALGQVAHLYQLYDCDHDFSDDAAKNLSDACKEAHETPEIAAVRGSVTCSFDMENYIVSAKTTVISPEYHIAPNGDVKKIVKGDLSVTAKQCKTMTSEKNLTSGNHHPATEDLCYNYFPDKNFAKYQEKAECSDDRKPASSVTAPTGNVPSGDDVDEDSDTDVAADVQQDLISYETVLR